MRIIIRAFLTVILFTGTVCTAFSQGGSNYSIFGIGDIQNSVGAAYEGMGRNAIAVVSPYAINMVNPAGWSYVQTTRLQAGFMFSQMHLTDGNTSSDQNNGKFQGISGLFSIDTALGIGVSFGFRPYSSVSYVINQVSTLTVDGQAVTASSQYNGKGGLSTAFLGGAFRPVEGLAVGVAALYHFGKISSSITTSFSDANYFISTVNENDGFSGAGFNLGLMYTGMKNWTLGAILQANGTLTVTNDLHYNGASLLVDSIISTKHEVKLPLTFGVGASYQSGKFLFTGEVQSSDFSTFSYRATDFTRFCRANSISFGVSRLAGSSDARLFDRWGYNAGFGYRQQYYEIKGQGIDETYATFGVQAPVARNAYLDAALTGGLRGTTTNGLIQEVFARFSFSVSIGETWFKPFKRD